jgi:HPr kinase/phosphorylase
MDTPLTISLEKFYRDLHETMGLSQLVDCPLKGIDLFSKDVHRPGMALMGFMKNFLTGRLQVLGESEMAYLETLSLDVKLEAIMRLRELQPPAIIVTCGHVPPEQLVTVARQIGVPLFSTAVQTEEFIHSISLYLADEFAPRSEVHGSLVDVYGVGILITGRSGIGKSECALDLVERGHRLVADDIVEIRKVSDEVIIGRFREVLQHNIEIRGVGVIDVQAIFGIRSIRMQKRIELEINLQQWDEDRDYERTGLVVHQTEYLGISIPRLEIPIVPGKNLTVIAEVVALDFMMKIYGVDAAQDLNRRIMETLHSGDRLRNYLRTDKE